MTTALEPKIALGFSFLLHPPYSTTKKPRSLGASIFSKKRYLALRPLRGTASLLKSRLLAFYRTGITSQELLCLQNNTQIHIKLDRARANRLVARTVRVRPALSQTET
jgi:hypothetical protein